LFSVQVENEPRASIPAKQGTSPEQTSALEESIFKLSGQLSTITRNQKYFRTRENRNFSTVRSTERRIFNFSVIESLLMMCMAGLQVFVVRFFFQVGYFWPSLLSILRPVIYKWNEMLTSYCRERERDTCEGIAMGFWGNGGDIFALGESILPVCIFMMGITK
jgi:hypothetical protein